MRDWDLVLSFDRKKTTPIFLQIVAVVIADIRRGRLKPGARLPGTRRLAESLKVSRNTALAAYDELARQGFLVSSQARGVFVAEALPIEAEAPARAARSRTPAEPGFALPPLPVTYLAAPYPRVKYNLSGGLPDLREVPVALLARAYRRALTAHARSGLGYGDPAGHPRLRAALGSMLSATRALATGPEDVIVTSGSQMALYLVARSILQPGDRIAVEDPGYRSAWAAFREAGAIPVPIAVDENGARLDGLAGVKAIYLTPNHQYPTTAALSPARRQALLAFAEKERVAIIEDDYDHEFHYDARPLQPLASLDRSGVVIYIGTLSKLLAPGLRLGYVTAPRPVLDRVRAHRSFVDLNGDQVIECALADVIEEGELQRHARAVQQVAKTRRDVLAKGLAQRLGDALVFSVPAGGLSIWCGVKKGVDVEAWAARALKEDVAFSTGKRFDFHDRPTPFARFGFLGSREEELLEATRRLAATL
jgi:GntR family transcriptional regulator/MocR family aminotransferase